MKASSLAHALHVQGPSFNSQHCKTKGEEERFLQGGFHFAAVLNGSLGIITFKEVNSWRELFPKECYSPSICLITYRLFVIKTPLNVFFLGGGILSHTWQWSRITPCGTQRNLCDIRNRNKVGYMGGKCLNSCTIPPVPKRYQKHDKPAFYKDCFHTKIQAFIYTSH